MRLDEINIHEKELCVKLVIYKNYTEMHGQQNIKHSDISSVICVSLFDFFMHIGARALIVPP